MIQSLRICVSIFVLFATVGSGATTTAHDFIPGPPQTRPILIENAVVHLGNGTVRADHSLLFDDGVIVEVARKIKTPPKATVIPGKGRHVYPGLIDSFTDLGLREITAVDVSVDSTERGDQNPNVRSWIAFNPDSELIPVARAGGVLLAHVVPGGRLIQGQSAVMQLDGWSVDEMKLAAPTGLCISWESIVPSGDDPKELAKKYDEKIKELAEQLNTASRYRDAVASDPNTTTDIRLESWVPVINGERPVFVYAERFAAIEAAVRFFTSREIPIVICGGSDAMYCADLLIEHDIPVILKGTYRLPRRRHDSHDALYALPKQLHKQGIRFAIAGEGPGYPGGASNVRNLAYHAGAAVSHGLPREQAVHAITGAAAKILGLGDRIGTLEAGHDATLIIADDDILESFTQVTHAYIQGRAVDLNSRHRQLFDKYKQKPAAVKP